MHVTGSGDSCLTTRKFSWPSRNYEQKSRREQNFLWYLQAMSSNQKPLTALKSLHKNSEVKKRPVLIAPSPPWKVEPVPSKPEIPALLTKVEAAAYLNDTERMITRLVQEKKLGIVKIGRKVKIPRKELDDFIERNSRPRVA